MPSEGQQRNLAQQILETLQSVPERQRLMFLIEASGRE